MASASPLAQNVNMASGIADFLKLFSSSSTQEKTSSLPVTQTSTSQTVLSKEAVDAMLKTLMEGTSGLASVASGQKAAGMYNTTARTMLTNDLLARSAAAVAEKSAPKVDTVVKTGGETTSSKVTPATISPKLGLGAAGLLLGNKKIREKLGIPGLDEAMSALGLGSDLATGGTAGMTADQLVSAADAFSMGTTAGNNTAPLMEAGAGVLSGNADSFLSGMFADNFLSDTASSGLDTAAYSLFGGDFGAESMGSSFFDTSASAIDSSVDSGFGGFPVIGAVKAISDGEVTGREVGSVAGGWGGAEAGAALGTAIFPGVGTAIGGVLGGLFGSSAGGDAGDSVICTELHRVGILSDSLYATGAAHFYHIPLDTIKGYQLWAIPFTKLMRKHPFLNHIVKYPVIARAEHIAGNKNILGYLTISIGQPICSILGKLFCQNRVLASNLKGV